METNAPRRIESAFVWMIAPAAILFTILLTIPLLTGFFYTFTNYQGYGDWRFVGLQNYINLFGDDVIWAPTGSRCCTPSPRRSSSTFSRWPSPCC